MVVLLGTALAIWFLTTRPVRLMAFMPAALSMYFFIPWVTLLTLWQTIPLLLFARLWIKGKIIVARFARPFVAALFVLFLVAMGYGLLLGQDKERAVIRSMYYLGAFALFLFSYEMGRKQEGYDIFLKGMAITGAVFAAYAVYQIIAVNLGLPVRGILRGAFGSQLAYENGLLRVNSLASEPKRLGYVLIVGALACGTMAHHRAGAKRRRYAVLALLCGFMSVMTFSGSYFIAVFLFLLAATLLYPKKLVRFALPGLLVLGGLFISQPDNRLVTTITDGIERRSQEVEVGLDGTVVYRQEFYANDYLANHPIDAVFGVGLGQYYRVLRDEYGSGVGLSDGGVLLPMNSTLLELVFDLSGLFMMIFYSGLIVLIFQLRRKRLHFLTLALLFLSVQSLTISTFLFLCVFAGVGVAQLQVRRSRVGCKSFALTGHHAALGARVGARYYPVLH